MRHLLLIVFFSANLLVFGQRNQITDDDYAFRINGHVFMQKLALDGKNIDTSKTYFAEKYLFERVGTYSEIIDNKTLEYYKLSLVPFRHSEPITQEMAISLKYKIDSSKIGTSYQLFADNKHKETVWVETGTTKINHDDIGTIFVIPKFRFDELVKDEYRSLVRVQFPLLVNKGLPRNWKLFLFQWVQNRYRIIAFSSSLILFGIFYTTLFF